MNAAERHEFVIVGSGAGGATLARELARRGKDVVVVERGRRHTKVGTAMRALRIFETRTIPVAPPKSKEGVIIWRGLGAGGSTFMSCGNGVRALERELEALGVPLGEELSEVERELEVAPIDERLLSAGSERLREAAARRGYSFEPMPKFVDAVRCARCGACSLGCAPRARWSAISFLDEATDAGAVVRYDALVTDVVVDDGRARGVTVRNGEGAATIYGDTVVLAAGGLGTPVLLQRAGIAEAGRGLFADLLVNTYGVVEQSGVNQLHEPQMALVDTEFHESEGFLLSPFVNGPREARFIEAGLRGMGLPSERLLGIMTKIADEPVGTVGQDGAVSKPITERDRKRLARGDELAREVLSEAGCRADSCVTSTVQCAHPGGTAAIGRVVDSDLRTPIEALYVCDGSVLPTAPGAPPILTIVALAKRLARQLAG